MQKLVRTKVMLVIRWPVGGIRTYLRYVFSNAAFNNYEFIIVAPDDNELRTYLSEVFESKEYKFYGTEPGTRSFALTVSKLAKVLKPNIVHSHGFTAGLVVAFYLLISRSFRASTKHILTTHDVFLSNAFKGIKGRLKHNAIKFLLKQVDVVNPCGFDAAENFSETFPELASKKIRPIRNGILLDLFQVNSIKRDFRQEFKISQETVILGFFGRFMGQKGFDLLVDAVAKIDATTDLDICVVCLGWGGFIREEQANIKAKGLKEKFFFAPQTNQMAEALLGVDIVTIPSRWEACPLLPMEAMICGAPIVASDCIGLKEVCAGSPTAIFKCADFGDLADKVLSTVENLGSIKVEAAEYSAKAQELFSSVNTAASLNGLYKAISCD